MHPQASHRPPSSAVLPLDLFAAAPRLIAAAEEAVDDIGIDSLELQRAQVIVDAIGSADGRGRALLTEMACVASPAYPLGIPGWLRLARGPVAFVSVEELDLEAVCTLYLLRSRRLRRCADVWRELADELAGHARPPRWTSTTSPTLSTHQSRALDVPIETLASVAHWSAPIVFEVAP
jgi:hypothetical protein